MKQYCLYQFYVFNKKNKISSTHWVQASSYDLAESYAKCHLISLNKLEPGIYDKVIVESEVYIAKKALN